MHGPDQSLLWNWRCMSKAGGGMCSGSQYTFTYTWVFLFVWFLFSWFGQTFLTGYCWSLALFLESFYVAAWWFCASFFSYLRSIGSDSFCTKQQSSLRENVSTGNWAAWLGWAGTLYVVGILGLVKCLLKVLLVFLGQTAEARWSHFRS